MQTQAVVVGSDHVARLENVELPDLTPTRVRLRTLLGGVSCGTEADCASGRATYLLPPFISGYQAVARVVQIGREVHGLRVGDLVFTTGGGLWSMAHLAGGSHARELVVEAADAHRLEPDHPSLPTAAYATLGAVGLEGLQRMQPVAGEAVLVFGLGMLGLLAGKAAQLRGLRVIGVNRSAWKCQVARRLGFDAVCAPVAEEIAAALASIGLQHARYALDLTGSQTIFDLALTQLSRFGHFCLLGYYPEPFRVNFDICHARQLTLHNPVGLGDQLPQVLAWIAEGRLNLEPAVQTVVRPEQTTEFYRDLVAQHTRYLGVLLDWQDPAQAPAQQNLSASASPAPVSAPVVG